MTDPRPGPVPVSAATWRKLETARSMLVFRKRFYAALVLGMPMIPRLPTVGKNGKPRQATMSTDGRRIFFNPAYVDALPIEQLTGVLAHEGLHKGLGHHARRGKRDPKRWNIATDCRINPILAESKIVLPAGALNLPPNDDPRFRGLSAEEIYELIPDDEDDDDGDGDGGDGDVEDPTHADGSPLDDAEMSQAISEAHAALASAAAMTQRHGSVPGEIAKLLQQARQPLVRWQDVLRDFLVSAVPTEQTWVPPNRRHLHRGLILPGRERTGCPALGWFQDTSGSVSDDDVQQVWAERDTVLREIRPETLHAIYCDAAISAHQELTADDLPVPAPRIRRGGTDFRPPFDYVARHGIDIAAAVYLTDLDGPFPHHAPPYPVLWITVGSVDRAPFGTVIRMRAR